MANLVYRYGLISARDGNNDLAIHWLLRGVSLNPWNWGAWEELSDLIRDVRHVCSPSSSSSVTAGAYLETYNPT